jgi:hypothetical protein
MLGPATGISADATPERVAAATGVVAGGVHVDGARGAAASNTSKGYRLLHNADGSVVRWNPCAPVRYQVNLAQAPRSALRDVQESIRLISKATGISFVYAGTTTAVPQQSYGAQARPWDNVTPPLVIAWARAGKGAGRTDALSGGRDELGVGGWRSAWWSDASGKHAPRIVTGYVIVNSAANSRLPAGFSAGARGSVLLHELGHVMGLDHVADSHQLMYPRMTKTKGLGQGDLAGLRAVGRAARCLP